MSRARVRIDLVKLQRLLWPGEEYRVKIVGADLPKGARAVVLTVEGDRLPDAGDLRPIVTTVTSTEFRPALPPLKRPP